MSREITSITDHRPLDEIIEIFERNGFHINTGDSRKKGEYEKNTFHTTLDGRIPHPFNLFGYTFLGSGFIAKVDREGVQITALAYDDARIHCLKGELEGYGRD